MERADVAPVQLEPGWKEALKNEFRLPYMQELKAFLVAEKKARKVIYPPGKDIFNALNYTPLDRVRVVIIGQDPYHGPHQAHGLCFSVLPGVKIPASLQNIYKELASDVHATPVKHGCLIPWARQGILLLNAALTVEKGQPNSHQGKGWERFTDAVINILNQGSKPIIFVLWGSFALQKGHMIDRAKHIVLSAAHPSPFSAHRGFFGCKHFSKINQVLQDWRQTPINWQLPAEITIE